MQKNRKINSIIRELNIITDTVIIYNNIDNVSLEKNSTNKNIINKDFINNNKIIKENLNNKIKDIYKQEIINFINILNNKLHHCNFNILNNNINTLEISNKVPFIIGRRILAAYNPLSNILFLNKKNYKKAISHELLHMASTKKIDDDYICSGFKISKITTFKNYGTFLNEGFTEYLNSKYFIDTKCYRINKTFIEILSIIIGKELMEQLYFNSDLKGLIKELIKYNNSLEDVIKFIINTDIIHKNIYKLSIIKRLKLRKAFIETNRFLIHTYYEKIKQCTQDENEIVIAMNLFINLLENIKIDIGFNDRFIKVSDEYKEKKLTQ